MTRLTDDADDEVAPSWSHDGTIGAVRRQRMGGTWQVMQFDVADRSRTAADRSMAAMPRSPRRMASRSSSRGSSAPGCGRWPPKAASATLLVPAVRAAENVNWRVTSHGIYYVGATADQPVVRRAPLNGGPGVDVAWIGNYSWPGFAVTRDRQA